jgi:hypothetical protein
MTTQSFKDDCERWIVINTRGALEYQSVLRNRLGLSRWDWDHLFSIIEDHTISTGDQSEQIIWHEVWEDWDKLQEGPQT